MCPEAANNTFYLNDFVNNNGFVMPDVNFLNQTISPNLWNSDSVGNYWSDYQTKYPIANELNASDASVRRVGYSLCYSR